MRSLPILFIASGVSTPWSHSSLKRVKPALNAAARPGPSASSDEIPEGRINSSC